jgi:type IV secretion system protein TrbG
MNFSLTIMAATFAIASSVVFGQETHSAAASQKAPVQVKRVVPGEAASQIPSLLQQYDFGTQIQTLQDPSGLALPDDPRPVFAVPDATKTTGPEATAQDIPSEFRLRTDIPLSATALEAVHVSERWQGGKNAPMPGPDGRVLYSFGAGLATVVCAPLRVCIIELQEGERIIGEPHIGDSVRWNISPASYGNGDESTPLIVLKPQASGLDTNLLITTDRRAYYVRLVSKPEDYVARVAFAYPEDDTSHKWQQQIAEQRANAEKKKREADLAPAMIAVEKMNFGYKVHGGDEHIRPLRVFDDGAKTYIQMPEDVQHREAPALLVIGGDGKGEMTNYRVKQQTYIVDRLFDRADLILGSGKKAQKVEIIRANRG